jgi:aminopeptidase N
MKIILHLVICYCISSCLYSQGHEKRLATIDIKHYQFNLELSDETDEIKGTAVVDINFKKPTFSFNLDLHSLDESTGKGMIVESLTSNGDEIDFEHKGNNLFIKKKSELPFERNTQFDICYKGIPADGLIIGNNRLGERTFFGDNWPNRAHFWLPTVDHPSDKASVEFIVTVPNHYQVVANGLEIEESNLDDHTKLHHWKTDKELPTKVMVIGVGRFGVQLAGHAHGIPVTSWIYSEEKETGFSDYKYGVGALEYFHKKIGNYPFEKLANVQSKTRYGGMENASCIFYYEASVNGKKDKEALFAHEIAHQWFGNSASEADWHHVWLSEGFATYFTHLYFEEHYGDQIFKERLQVDRETIFTYFNKNPAPIVDTTVSNINKVLNANSYQKGSWFLHMLRNKMGDDSFWKGIKVYYKKFKYGNAYSHDFKKVMESVSHQDLSVFFKQWLNQPGHPILSAQIEQIKKNKYSINITQNQTGTFTFPLKVKFSEGIQTLVKTFNISSKNQSFTFKWKGLIPKYTLDPDCTLLFEEK